MSQTITVLNEELQHHMYLPVPDEESADIREVAAMASYGWGVIP